jgi:serine/threonine protein kinase
VNGLPTLERDAEHRIAGRYTVLAELARGGMGIVYKVNDRAEGRTVALKQLHRHTAGYSRVRLMFQREYDTLARLEHPRIIRVHEYGEEEADGPYYTMALLEGTDLRELAPLPYTEVCRYLRDVAS